MRFAPNGRRLLLIFRSVQRLLILESLIKHLGIGQHIRRDLDAGCLGPQTKSLGIQLEQISRVLAHAVREAGEYFLWN